MNFCAIGSERIIVRGFSRCVSTQEALLLALVVFVTMLILCLLIATVGKVHVWWERRKNHDLRTQIAALKQKSHEYSL